jgi:hypothetical protein
MALFRKFLLALWIVGLAAGSALAEKRVALVIGNSRSSQ